MSKIILIFILCSLKIISYASINKDSLWMIWNDESNSDSIRFKSINQLSKQGYIYSNPDSSLYCSDLQFELAIKTGNKKIMADARNTQGIAYAIQSKFNYAIQKYMEALKYYEQINNKRGMASSYNNIGIIYSDLNDLDKSLNYYKKSLALKEELGDTLGMASTLNNIGVIYKGKNDFKTALSYYKKCLEIEKADNTRKESSTTLNNIAVAYKNLDSLNKAEQTVLKSINISSSQNSSWDMSISYNILSVIYYAQNKYKKAIQYANKAYQLSSEVNGTIQIQEALFNLYQSQKELSLHKESLLNYEKFIIISKKIENEDNQKEVIKQALMYDFEKEAVADSIKNVESKKIINAQLSLEKEENKRQKQLSYFLYTGLTLLAIFAIFILNRFRVTSKQKEVIETQKKTVDNAFNKLEEKNMEILASINYAKRIQTAILPTNKIVNQALPENFVLFKPKDIVAGDFYWVEQKDNKILFAAADCTGHGVPGAMVSVICNGALNRSVREFKLTDPGEILGKTREIVIQEFEKSDEDVKDGMDIALCLLDGNKLHFAGANNPLWVIRNRELIEFKADRQPIGRYDNLKPYTTHSIDLEKGDCLYIFSDGYVDQFGGEKGKKLKAKSFRELLLRIQDKTMKEQSQLINEVFESWRGELEQIDDVCVIGVRV